MTSPLRVRRVCEAKTVVTAANNNTTTMRQVMKVKIDNGGSFTVRYAFASQRGYYPDGKQFRTPDRYLWPVLNTIPSRLTFYVVTGLKQFQSVCFSMAMCYYTSYPAVILCARQPSIRHSNPLLDSSTRLLSVRPVYPPVLSRHGRFILPFSRHTRWVRWASSFRSAKHYHVSVE